MPDGARSPGRLPAINLHFQPKQWEAFISEATEILFGGAAFGGKSHLMREAAIMWCSEIPGLQVYLFRRVEDELIKNHMEGPQGFRNLLAPWVSTINPESGRPWCEIVEKEVRFWNGARIYLCHCKDEKHRFRYHGDEMHVLLVDELTTFSELIYRYLRFRVRMVGMTGALPEKYRKGAIGPNGKRNAHNLFPRVLSASNPGNIGHHWVKRTFGLETAGILQPTVMPEIEGGMVRQYIHARYTDNPIGMAEDPKYLDRMRGLGDQALVRAMLDGDWNIIAGGFFPEFSLTRHVLKAVDLPADVFSRRFRAHDHGSARPFSTGWYGIADEDWKAEGTLGNTIVVPRGALVRYRELYGKKPNEDNHGLKWSIERWAAEAIRRSIEPEESYRYTVVDTSMFDEDGGPSQAERADKVRVNGRRIGPIRKADKRRIPGWDQVRARFNPEDDDRAPPLLFLMDNQPDAIRLIQAVQHDELKIEDLDTDQEDHALDEIRYASMSRPRPLMKDAPRKMKGPKQFTYDWLMQVTESEQQQSVSRYKIDE